MAQFSKEKLEEVVKLLDNAMVDPDIDLEYCIPGVAMTAENCDESGDPYVLVKYSENKYVERKIKLAGKYLDTSAEEICRLITFSIEQFKEEIDSVQMS